MAQYEVHTTTTANKFLIDFSAFLTANGFSIDFDGVYNTSYRRLHFHKGAAHFDYYSSSALGIELYGCTGYDSGSAPSAQPGVSGGTKYINIVATGPGGYCFVSTVGGVYTGIIVDSGARTWGILVYSVVDKVGAWSGGFIASGNNSVGVYIAPSSMGYTTPCAQLYYNEAWSPIAAAGGLVGRGDNNNDLGGKGPFFWNNAFLPVPLAIAIAPVVDSSKRVPMGYLPGVFRVNGGDIYSVGETITISGSSYVILPRTSPDIGAAGGDYLFKLGN